MTTPVTGSSVLSGPDVRALTRLLRLIAAWLDSTASQAVADDLRRHLARDPGCPALAGSDWLCGQIAQACAMLGYRQMTGGPR